MPADRRVLVQAVRRVGLRRRGDAVRRRHHRGPVPVVVHVVDDRLDVRVAARARRRARPHPRLREPPRLVVLEGVARRPRGAEALVGAVVDLVVAVVHAHQGSRRRRLVVDRRQVLPEPPVGVRLGRAVPEGRDLRPEADVGERGDRVRPVRHGRQRVDVVVRVGQRRAPRGRPA